MTTKEPTGIDPAAWARYNELTSRGPKVRDPRTLRDEPTFSLEPYEIRIEWAGPISDLMHAVRRAASELEGQGEKSDRIALQLLTAMARFAVETEMP